MITITPGTLNLAFRKQVCKGGGTAFLKSEDKMTGTKATSLNSKKKCITVTPWWKQICVPRKQICVPSLEMLQCNERHRRALFLQFFVVLVDGWNESMN